MKKLIFSLLLALPLAVFAQGSGITIVLNNGDTLRTSYVGIINTPTLFNQPHIQLNPLKKDQKILIRDIQVVEGYDPEKGRFRHFRRMPAPYHNTLAERGIKTDRIDGYYVNIHQHGMYTGSYSWRHFFYAKDGDALKKMNLANLRADLNDSPLAMAHYRKANALRWTQLGLYAVGTALLVKGFHQSFSHQEEELTPPGVVLSENDKKSLRYMIGGAVMLSVPFYLNAPKQKYMSQALRAY
ncbi:hypothetical protein [Cesiribacter andamanensis]|uniref:DUF5683 domain-containing protein n=1 Tax=Cesiribacter andamanensis AMV16 TaxID=1279009 RepID=M7NJN0_9BACT|nr:hypothetical protein [Cesiribacter andamanensis]EMR02005.1 hypothetical protein ADICEAN_02864 [Cesiribacter andamanensis AMV16]